MSKRELLVRDAHESYYLIKFISNIRINEFSGCWEWIASKSPSGYSAYWYESRYMAAHVYIMKIMQRHIDGLYVDHVCRNRICCNPDHLRMVDPRTNVVENNSSPAFINANKTHCKYNHPFTPENTGMSKSKDGKTKRICLQCKRDRRAIRKDVFGKAT